MRIRAARFFVLFSLLFSFPFSSLHAAPNNLWSLGNPLVDAVDRGDIVEAKRLLKEGNPVDSHGDFGVTPLMRAAFRGHAALAELMIQSGANVDAADIGGATALHLAARNGHSELVSSLLHAGATIDAPDAEQWTPLMRAAMSGHRSIVTLLLAKGADIARKNESGQTVFSLAASAGATPVVQLLMADTSFASIDASERAKALSLARTKHNAALEALLSGESLDEAPSKLAQVSPPDSAPSAASSASSPSAPAVTTADSASVLAVKTKSPETPNAAADNASAPPAKAAPKKDESTKLASADTSPAKAPTKPSASQSGMAWWNPFAGLMHSKDSSPPTPVAKPVPNSAPSTALAQADETPPLIAEKPVIRSEILPPISRPSKEVDLARLDTPPSSSPATAASRFTVPSNSTSTSPQNSAASSFASSPTPASTAPRSGKRYLLQLGTFEDAGAAQENWEQLRHTLTALSPLQPDIIEAALGMERTLVYRLRANGFNTKKAAEHACAAARAKDVECFVVESALNIPADHAPPLVQEARASSSDSAASDFRAIPKEIAMTAPAAQSLAAAAAPAVSLSTSSRSPSRSTPKTARELQAEYNARNYPSLAASLPSSAEYSNPVAEEKLAQAQPIEGLPWKQAAAETSMATFSPPARADASAPLSLLPTPVSERPGLSASTNAPPFASAATQAPPLAPTAQGVTEAVRLPDDMQFAPGQALPITPRPLQGFSQASQQSLPGTWIAIGDFPNEQAAADYWLRMFKYNEAFSYMHMTMSAPMSASAKGVGIQIGPVQPSDALSVCRLVTSGGYGCYVKDDGTRAAFSAPQESTAYQAASAPMPPQIFSSPAQPAPVDQTASAFQPLPSPPSWIHLGNFRGEGDAEYYWMVMQQDHPDMFSGMQHFIDAPGQSDPSMRARLKLGPFANNRMAEQLCQDMRRARVPCMVVE